MYTWIGTCGEGAGRGRLTNNRTNPSTPSAATDPNTRKMACRNQRNIDRPINQTTQAIIEGIGSFNVLKNAITPLNHTGRCKLCNVSMLCTSIGNGPE